MSGLVKFLRGAIKYRTELRPQMVEQLKRIQDNAEPPKAICFSCMDSRVLPTRILNTDVGDMFLVRNAGNLVPHVASKSISTEPAGLELGPVLNNVRNVMVCGHSDCKAMNLLYDLQTTVDQDQDSPLKAWVAKNGAPSLTAFQQFNESGGKQPITFQDGPDKTFSAYIDPENKFAIRDKLSQVNTLQQIQNIASYPMLQPLLTSGQLKLHALWFDVHQGDLYIFSRQKEQFVVVSEETVNDLQEEIVSM